MIINTYLITGKNAAGEEGTWEIEAKNEKSLNEIIKDRGLQADKINGEDVKRYNRIKSYNPKGVKTHGL
jgi:type II secretory pathway component PulF